jgi:Protein of unknown function (DUF3800)
VGWLREMPAKYRSKADEGILMLWAYFDESGEHDRKTGHLRQLTVGGWIAPRDAWMKFDDEWSKALKWAEIPMFHMADFEAYRGQFTGWTNQKHKDVLNVLLKIIGENIRDGLGFTNRVFKLEPKQHFSDTYESSLLDCLMHVANRSAYTYGDQVSVVFAKHSDYRKNRIQKIFDFMNYGDAQLGTLAVSDPINVLPLQAADILAYEFQFLNRDDLSGVRRYPIRRLKEFGCKFRISIG